MVRIHDKKVDKIAKCSLLHDIINPLKRAKILHVHYSPILHGFMNTRKVKAKFKNFRVLLDSGFSSNILIGRIVKR